MTADVVLVVVGVSILVLGLLSKLLKRVFLSEALVALVVGVLLGPEVLGLVQPAAADARRVLEELARVSLAVSVTAIGLQVTRDDLRDNRSRAGLLLTAGMVGMWLMTAAGAALLLDLPWWPALLLGAVLTPTDPVVASALVTGTLPEENLPRWLRRTVQLESGANDGLAVAFVLLPLAFLTDPSSGAAHWARQVAREVGLAAVLGLTVGYLAARAVNGAARWESVEDSNIPHLGVGLALGVLGLAHLLGGSGVLASFLAGLVFSLSLRPDLASRLEHLQDTVEKLLIPPFFLLLGVLLPWSEWARLGAAGLVFALWALVLRRPPVVPLALASAVDDARGRAFLAWFGPIGVAAVYYALFIERFHPERYGRLFGAATLAVTASIVVHAVSATPGVRWYARRPPFGTAAHPFAHDVEERS